MKTPHPISILVCRRITEGKDGRGELDAVALSEIDDRLRDISDPEEEKRAMETLGFLILFLRSEQHNRAALSLIDLVEEIVRRERNAAPLDEESTDQAARPRTTLPAHFDSPAPKGTISARSMQRGPTARVRGKDARKIILR